MKKSAFTIIELIVIIVVIGIILGMGLKAGALVQSAKIRAEISNVELIRQAFYESININQKIPGDISNYGFITTIRSDMAKKALVDGGFIKLENFTNKYTGLQWHFARCIPSEFGYDMPDFYAPDSYRLGNTVTVGNICITSGTAPTDLVTELRMSCFYDSLADDSSYLTGVSRMNNNKLVFPASCPKEQEMSQDTLFLIKLK